MFVRDDDAAQIARRQPVRLQGAGQFPHPDPRVNQDRRRRRREPGSHCRKSRSPAHAPQTRSCAHCTTTFCPDVKRPDGRRQATSGLNSSLCNLCFCAEGESRSPQPIHTGLPSLWEDRPRTVSSTIQLSYTRIIGGERVSLSLREIRGLRRGVGADKTASASPSAAAARAMSFWVRPPESWVVSDSVTLL